MEEEGTTLWDLGGKNIFAFPCPLILLGLLCTQVSVALTLVSFPLVFSFSFSPSSRSDTPPFCLLICGHQVPLILTQCVPYLYFISLPPSLPLLSLGFLSLFWVLLFILLYLKRKQKFFHITVYFAYEQQYMSELIPSWEILWNQLVFDTYLGTNYPSLWISFFEAFFFVFRVVTSHRLQCRILLVISCVFYFLCALNLFCDETQFKSHLAWDFPR